MPNAQLDGICLIKIIDNDIKGVIINDFGIKALEFAVCYNLVCTKEEYANILNELKAIGGK